MKEVLHLLLRRGDKLFHRGALIHIIDHFLHIPVVRHWGGFAQDFDDIGEYEFHVHIGKTAVAAVFLYHAFEMFLHMIYVAVPDILLQHADQAAFFQQLLACAFRRLAEEMPFCMVEFFFHQFIQPAVSFRQLFSRTDGPADCKVELNSVLPIQPAHKPLCFFLLVCVFS